MMKFLRKFNVTIFGFAILINFVSGMNLPVTDIGDESVNNVLENNNRLGVNVDLGVLDLGLDVHLGLKSIENSATEETEATVVNTQTVEEQVKTSKETGDPERLGINLGLGVDLRSQSMENTVTDISDANSVQYEVKDSDRLGIDLGLDVNLRSQGVENSEAEVPQSSSAEQKIQDSESIESAETEVTQSLQTSTAFSEKVNNEPLLQTVFSKISDIPAESTTSTETVADTLEKSVVLETVDTEIIAGSEGVIATISETAFETSTNAAIVQTTTIAPLCEAPGLLPHESDCQLYYSCSLENSPDGNLRLQTLSCANYEAFNSKWGRCARELSACANEVTCMSPGSLADPLSNTSYYLCYPRQTAEGGYLIYHVQCKTGEVFLPALGKCFLDLTDFAHAYMSYNWTQVHDLTVVTSEYKQYRMEEKLQLKMEKEKAKLQKKLQKELEKLAKERAKEEAKGQKSTLYQ